MVAAAGAARTAPRPPGRGSGPVRAGDLAGGALAKSPAQGPAQGLTCGTCRTIVVKKDKCLVIYRFSRGRLQSVARGLQRHRGGSPPGRAVVSCAEAECAGQFFRIWPDATRSIARITDSDAASGATGRFRDRNYADSCRLVTAGDGKMDPVGHIGISTTSSLRAPWPHNNNTRIATPIQEERPHQCPHVLQRLSPY